MRALPSIALLALFAGLVVVADAAPSSADPPALTARASTYGRILFDGRGFALYAFTKDTAKKSNCTGACAKAWPPFTVTQTPRAGRGVKASLLGTIARGGGTLQATYAGKPLYFYVGDREPLQVLCQNVREFGGLWLVVQPDGTLVR